VLERLPFVKIFEEKSSHIESARLRAPQAAQGPRGQMGVALPGYRR
jgi:hypothetical protein